MSERRDDKGVGPRARVGMREALSVTVRVDGMEGTVAVHGSPSHVTDARSVGDGGTAAWDD